MDRSNEPVLRRPAAPHAIPVLLATLILVLVAGMLALRISSAVAHLAVAHPVAGAPRAQVARTVNATDVGHLHFVRNSGSLLIEEGVATGTLPGNMKARCDIGPTVRASFTIYTRYGSIRGKGTATARTAGIYETFAGSLVATGGTGRYAHAHGHAGLYGVFNRRTYALTLQTTGRLSY